MAKRILVVDPNEAFATMLQDMLVVEGGYHVEVTYAGSEALARLRRADFDLTIVDVDLDPADMGYQALIRQIRESQPTMRLMLIPLMGEDLPAQARTLDIQGTLSKPFFADDLLPGIEEALAKEVSESAPEPAPAPEPTPASISVAKADSDVERVLSDLARETLADAVLLLSATSDETGILAQVSTLSDAQTRGLAEHSIAIVQVAQEAARLLGQPNAPFEHNMFEGDSLRLYVLALAEDVLVAVVTPVSTPLGTIRHNLRRASRHLADRALT